MEGGPSPIFLLLGLLVGKQDIYFYKNKKKKQPIDFPMMNSMESTNPFGFGNVTQVERGSDLWNFLRRKLNLAYGARTDNYNYPGSLPISLSRNRITDIFYTWDNWAVTDKCDGMRISWMICMFHGMPVVAIVNRRMEFYICGEMPIPDFLTKPLADRGGGGKTSSSRNMHNIATVFDGDMVVDRDSGRHIFIIADHNMHRSRNLRKLTYGHRMDIAAQCIDEWIRTCERTLGYQFSNDGPYSHPFVRQHKIGGGSRRLYLAGSPFDVCVKPVMPVGRLYFLHRHVIPSLPYHVDGLCFTNTEKMLRPMMCPDILKYKENHTFDLLWWSVAIPLPAFCRRRHTDNDHHHDHTALKQSLPLIPDPQQIVPGISARVVSFISQMHVQQPPERDASTMMASTTENNEYDPSDPGMMTSSGRTNDFYLLVAGSQKNEWLVFARQSVCGVYVSLEEEAADASASGGEHTQHEIRIPSSTLHGEVVECYLEYREEVVAASEEEDSVRFSDITWRPKCRRTYEKGQNPNASLTVLRTLGDRLENIAISELFGADEFGNHDFVTYHTEYRSPFAGIPDN